jgi:signal transduction histidine kinase/ActR/RegA family two-component response regulator
MTGLSEDDSSGNIFMPSKPVYRESCGCRNKYYLSTKETGEELEEVLSPQSIIDIFADYFGLSETTAKTVLRHLLSAWHRIFPDYHSEEISQPAADYFFDIYEKSLNRFFSSDSNKDPEQIFSFFKDISQSGLISPVHFKTLEPALYRTIFTIRERLAINAQYEMARLNTVVNSLKCELLGTRERNSLVQSLANHLIKIGITTAGIALYKDRETSLWMGSFSPEGICMREESFQAKHLVPEHLRRHFSQGIFMVQPLFIEDRSLGYFIHIVPELPGDDGIIFEDLRSVISYALKGIIQFEEVTLAKQKVQEIDEQSRVLLLQKEAAQAASEAKSQFLANVSHEIRTPMNAVLGMSELLLSEELNERQKRYAEDIKTSALVLLEIINEILDISKIQSGKMNLVPVHYDFRALVDNVCSMVQFLIKKNNIVFETEMKGEIPQYLYGDDVRLRQMLLNILGNAAKFTKAGYIRFSVTVSDAYIRFIVSDSGIGIRPEDLPTIFDIFKQADTIENREKIGTGLGLSITKALTEMMNGRISVESVYGKGTTFRIVIPKVVGDETKIRQSGAGKNVTFSPDTKILVVDDNAINLNVISGLLQLYNITASTAGSGRQAVEMTGNTRFDLVFMDHMMPEMDGVEATQIMREMGVTVPIIALTANAVANAKEMLLAAGMDDFLSKPVIKDVLTELLIKWIPASRRTE